MIPSVSSKEQGRRGYWQASTSASSWLKEGGKTSAFAAATVAEGGKEDGSKYNLFGQVAGRASVNVGVGNRWGT